MGESISGDRGGEYIKEVVFSEVTGETWELPPRRALQVGHSFTNREISSFGTLRNAR